MAENDDKSLIGFDPLAWMDESTDKNTDTDAVVAKDQVKEDEIKAESEPIADIKVILASTLTIQSVSDLHGQLKKLLETQNIIEIDASSVERVDTANLQLLAILKKTAIELHKEIVIDFPSDAFVESAEVLGLSEILEVDQAAAGFF